MQQYNHRVGLKQLFDSQRFYRNRRLQVLIEDSENRYSNLLSDDDLSFVNAAGETDAFRAADDAKRREETAK